MNHCYKTPHQILTDSVSSVQLLRFVRLFVTPWTAACQASLSMTKAWSLLLNLAGWDTVLRDRSPLYLPLPSKAIKLLFSTSPRTLVSEIGFGTYAERLISQHHPDDSFCTIPWAVTFNQEDSSSRKGRLVQRLSLGTASHPRRSVRCPDPSYPLWMEQETVLGAEGSLVYKTGKSRADDGQGPPEVFLVKVRELQLIN